MIRYAKLPLDFDVKAIQSELLSLAEAEWQPHFNSYHYTGSWTVLALRSPDGSSDNIIPELMQSDDFAETKYMAYFPSVKKMLAGVKCPIMSVRFLNLKPGAAIKEHQDNELAFEKGEARLHFPIFTNPEVEFYAEQDRIILNEGECWYLNANLPHRVANYGRTDRIHLVMDCTVDDWLTNIMNSASKIAYKEEVINERELLLMIENLRSQNTETAERMALAFEQKLKEHNRAGAA
ncbi:MAG TPA: aspartyl/asparaginyl beta-hydroxylase domain-containing protein [Mucilaginibacter sp.]|jgi:quercetin dioxygenase-like cupin family protein|nr:aspartyl/asparaginyl beta-hydroxylase domain-containing protein [Mucilaginibacter sp.]